MILNTQIWQQTVSAAKQAASSSPAWLRAIERADAEIRRSRYWSFDGSTLTIQSTTSKKMYRIEAGHTCEAQAHGHKACKHLAAHRLMVRYRERLRAVPVLPAQQADETRSRDRFAEYTSAPLIKREGNAAIVDGWAV